MRLNARNRETESLALLRKELQLAGVNLRTLFPDWARPKVVRESILRELIVALEAPVHEGMIPPYGSIIVPNDAELGALLPLEEKDLELARKAADGSSALLGFRESSLAGLVVIEPSGAPHLDLARTARSLDGIGIRRERSGVVHVYARIGSLRHAGRQWSGSPSVLHAITRIRQAAPMVDYDVLADLLDFAYYVLSPWGIGATLVWILSDRDPPEIKADLRPFKLSVSPTAEEPSLSFAAHLLAQFDGATFVSRQGKLLTTGIHLNPSPRAEQLIPPHLGTRHTSARRASYDLSDALIATVSADGPVTVFSDGVSVFELRYSIAELEKWIRKVSGKSVEDAIWTSVHDKICPNCGTRL